ncbi:MAG: protein kinase, partial [Oscillospiraceae bacterium]|nr:protein kinase [Oscillospiraceae bacterium]
LIEKKTLNRTYRSAMKHIRIPSSEEELERLYANRYIISRDGAQAYFDDEVQKISQEIEACYLLKGYTNIVSYEDHKINSLPDSDGPGYDIFIRMEYLTSLTKHLWNKGLTMEELLRLGIDICTALELLEKHSMVHRDIKPDNVFLNDMGVFKLGDFGVSRTMSMPRGRMTKKGTYDFMAPELCQGRPCGYSVDQYSLGIMMYRLLNHDRNPFWPSPPEVSVNHQIEAAYQKRFGGEPLPPPFYGEPALKEIVLKACAVRAEDRWESPAAMRKALICHKEDLKPSQLQMRLFEPYGASYVDSRSTAAPASANGTRKVVSQGEHEDTGKTQYKPPPDASSAKEKTNGRFQLPLPIKIALAIAAALVLIAGAGMFFAGGKGPSGDIVTTPSAQDPAQEPTQDPAQESTQDAAQKPAQDAAQKPAQDAAQKPAQ